MGRDEWLILLIAVSVGLLVLLALISVRAINAEPADVAKVDAGTLASETGEQIYRNSWLSLVVIAFFSAGAYLLVRSTTPRFAMSRECKVVYISAGVVLILTGVLTGFLLVHLSG